MIVPSIIAIGPGFNLWFKGKYFLQLQLPKDIRSQYPNDWFYRGLFSTYTEPFYDQQEEYVTLGMIIAHILFSFIWLAIPCCKAEAQVNDRTFAIIFTRGNRPLIQNLYGNITFFGSTILGVASIFRLAYKFIGWTSFEYTKLGTQYVDAITLMLIPSYSFYLFGVAVVFHIFVFISFIVTYCGTSQQDEHNNNYVTLNNNLDSNDLSEDRSARIALTDPEINEINEERLPERNRTSNLYRKDS